MRWNPGIRENSCGKKVGSIFHHPIGKDYISGIIFVAFILPIGWLYVTDPTFFFREPGFTPLMYLLDSYWKCSEFVLKIDFHPSSPRFSDPTFEAEVLNSHGACAKSCKFLGPFWGMTGQRWVCFSCWAKKLLCLKYIELKVGEWGRK